MPGYDYGLLAQAEEDAIHNTQRLLSVEERPYRRIASRLLAPDSLLNRFREKTTIPVPETEDALERLDEETIHVFKKEQDKECEWREWEGDLLIDVGLLELTIARYEMSHKANKEERERYANDKERHTANAQKIREHNVELKAQLDQAKETLAQRKKYDQLAKRITGNNALKSREELAELHKKLDLENDELQAEIDGYHRTFGERRDQFGRIMEEMMEMRRMIKDEKEEAERKEGMSKDADDVDDGEVVPGKSDLSNAGTPRPDAAGSTPLQAHGGTGSGTLRVPGGRSGPPSRSPSVAPSTKSKLGDREKIGSASAQADDYSSGPEEGEEQESTVGETRNEADLTGPDDADEMDTA